MNREREGAEGEREIALFLMETKHIILTGVNKLPSSLDLTHSKSMAPVYINFLIFIMTFNV